MPKEKEFAFNLTLLTTVKVNAETEKEARALINEAFHIADSHFGAWPNGDPILAEASMEGEAELFEIDQEPAA